MRTRWPSRTWIAGPGAPPSKPQAVYFHAGRDLDDDVLERELDVDDVALGNGGELGGEGLMGCDEVLGVLAGLAGVADEALAAGGRRRRGMCRRRGGGAVRGRLGVVLRLLRDIRGYDGGGRPDEALRG